MKNIIFAIIISLFLVGQIWADQPGQLLNPHETVMLMQQQEGDTVKEGKKLEDIIEEEGWKLKRPFTGTDWNWDFIWEKEKEKSKTGKKGYFRGGAGGMDYYILPVDLSALNADLSLMNVETMPKKMFLSGGGGWAFLGSSFRIGGLGAGGSVEVGGGIPGVQREVVLTLGFGGVIIEKVFHPFNRSEVYLSLMLGSGGASLELKQSSLTYMWNDIIKGYTFADTSNSPSNFYTYQNKLETSFFTAMPSIGFRYNVLRWFAIGGNVGYLYTLMDSPKWKLDGHRINFVPKIDFSNVVYRINFYFGG